MDDVFKNEKYNVRGVKISIFIQGNNDYFERSRLREAILEFHEENDLCLKFSEIVYQFESEDIDKKRENSGEMWVYINQIKSGRIRIHINNDKDILNKDILTIKKSLLHELTHAWYYRTFTVANEISKTNGRISNFLKKRIRPYIEEFHDLRTSFHEDFAIGILIEGIAVYVSELKYENSGLDEKTFDGLYLDAVTESRHFSIMLNNYLNRRKSNNFSARIFLWINNYGKLIKTLSHASYDIGHHMVQAILYIDKTLTIEDVCNMNHLSFMKKYDACMNLTGKQPVVSLNSKNGILDYQQMLIDLRNVYDITQAK